MKIYTFKITSRVAVKAKTGEEARNELEQAIEHYKYAVNENTVMLDDIVANSQIGNIMIAENLNK